MHRSIHKLWGFGRSTTGTSCPASSPLNNSKLSTTLEMVLNRDGTVDKVTRRARRPATCRSTRPRSTSRINAGPIPIRRARSAPPTARSTSTGSSTATSASARPRGVDYFILDNPPASADHRSSPTRRSRPHPVATPPAAAWHAPVPAASPARSLGRTTGRTTATSAACAASTTSDTARRCSAWTRRSRWPRRRRPRARRHRSPTPAAPAAPPAHARPIRRRARSPRRWFKALAAGDAAALRGDVRRCRSRPSGKDVTKRDGAGRDVQRPGGRGERRRARGESSRTAGLRAAIGKLPAQRRRRHRRAALCARLRRPRDTLILILAQRGRQLAPDW